jgi:hypothetical protein
MVSVFNYGKFGPDDTVKSMALALALASAALF